MPRRFVVHEHDARSHHFDFRLEIDGVLRSWAIPKGPSMNPADKRLSVSVEDHDLEYIDFEGIIPEGSYGAGAVAIWDNGTLDKVEEGEEKISFRLNGEKLTGSFTLLRLKKSRSGKDWLLIKKKDEFADPVWKLRSCLTKQKRAELEEKSPPCETF